MRRHPGSRRVPWTTRGRSSALAVRYVHLPELGGRRTPKPDSPRGGATALRLTDAAVVEGERIVYPPAQGELFAPGDR